jgi:putative nucleotidyltransferase-like protein
MARTSALAGLPVEERLLCILARLDATESPEWAPTVLDGPIDWDRLWTMAHRHEVVPLLWWSLRARPELRSRVPTGFALRAERRYLATMIRNAARVDELGRVLRGFADASIDVMPVKGPMVGESVYRNVTLRVFDDLDILVPPGQISAAREALRGLGYRTRATPRFEEVDHQFHDLQYFREVGGGEQCLELHWDLWPPARFPSDLPGLWARARPSFVAGVAVRVLSDEDILLHLAIHRTSAPLRLRMVCDVAELVRDRGDRLDWEVLVSRAACLGATTALHMILDLAADLLGAPVPADVIARTRPGLAKRWILDRTCGARALFRPVADDDLKQQPRLVYRIAELDGFARIARSAFIAVVRKPAKWRYQQRMSSFGFDRRRRP